MRPMTFHPLRELLRKRPFQPFRLVMSNGQVHEVRYPDMAFLTRNDILVGIDVDDDGSADRVKICHLPNGDAIEPLTTRWFIPDRSLPIHPLCLEGPVDS